MDTRTGELRTLEEAKAIDPELTHHVAVDNRSLTKKQRKQKRVSKHDNRSALGKLFLQARLSGTANASARKKARKKLLKQGIKG